MSAAPYNLDVGHYRARTTQEFPGYVSTNTMGANNVRLANPVIQYKELGGRTGWQLYYETSASTTWSCDGFAWEDYSVHYDPSSILFSVKDPKQFRRLCWCNGNEAQPDLSLLQGHDPAYVPFFLRPGYVSGTLPVCADCIAVPLPG